MSRLSYRASPTATALLGAVSIVALLLTAGCSEHETAEPEATVSEQDPARPPALVDRAEPETRSSEDSIVGRAKPQPGPRWS